MLKRTIAFAVTSVFFIVMFSALASGCTSTPTSSPPSTTTTGTTPVITLPPGQEPIEIESVIGPLQPINPGGPIVEITLKNVAAESVVSLTATLEAGKSFDFIFDVTPSNPLLPGQTTNQKLTLIGGGFSENLPYPLTINGTLQDGATFAYSKQVFIVLPANG